jgi:hypothetical protein
MFEYHPQLGRYSLDGHPFSRTLSELVVVMAPLPGYAASWQYEQNVICGLLRRGVEIDLAERASEEAFLALQREYLAGRQVGDIPRFAEDYALAFARGQMHPCARLR